MDLWTTSHRIGVLNFGLFFGRLLFHIKHFTHSLCEINLSCVVLLLMDYWYEGNLAAT